MSLTNYSELKDSIASYLARTDLTDQIPDFIRLAERRMRREVRIRQMLVSVDLTAVSGNNKVTLPTDFLEARDFVLVGNPTRPLNYLSPSALSRNAISSTSGRPIEYTILAEQFQLSPVPDFAYTLSLLYFAAPDFLSDSNDSNGFLVNVPDMLLYASLLEAEPYLMNDARLSTWVSMYERASISVEKSNETGQYSGVPLAIKAV
jgi:hypothetical protein